MKATCPYCLNEARIIENLDEQGWYLAIDCWTCCITATRRFDHPGDVPWRRALESNLDKLVGK